LALPLVLVPAAVLARRGSGPLLGAFVYFSAVGLGFMALEIALLQKASLLLGSPTASVGVVLAAILVGAGLGSLSVRSRVLAPARFGGVIAALVPGGVISVLCLEALAGPTAGWPLAGRALLTALVVGAVAFPMGMPLPHGLAAAAARGPGLTAWAWGVNGFASVVGALLAALLATHMGLRGLAACAGACYLAAGAASRFVSRGKDARVG
jgi:hypothetical protein